MRTLPVLSAAHSVNMHSCVRSLQTGWRAAAKPPQDWHPVVLRSVAACRLFLKKLKETLRIPVLALVDSDPYGLKILSVYMKGEQGLCQDDIVCFTVA